MIAGNGMVAAGDRNAAADQVIKNNGFWPDIEPARFRDSQRVDSTVTAARLENALIAAMHESNRTLSNWQAMQLKAGFTRASGVPVESWQAQGIWVDLYLRAVYSLAMASLSETYADYSASGKEKRAEQIDMLYQDYRRNARWAVSELLGVGHTVVELI